MPLFLDRSFDKTYLDLENPGPGGYFNILDTSTIYPATNTGTPTINANPGAPTNFFQRNIPTKTYLEYVKSLPNRSNLLNLSGDIDPVTELPANYTIFDATNLDTEKSRVDGGIPYKQDKDPTVYPVTTKRVGSTIGGFNPIQAQGATKFTQTYSAINPYLK